MPNPTEQKIKNLQFKRNKTVYQSLSELVSAVKDQSFIQKPEIADMKDGELILFRYKDTTRNIATLMGCIYQPESGTKEIHLEMATDEIKNIVNDKVNSAVATLKVKVDPNDKILKTDSTGNLTSVLSLTKDDSTNEIKLVGKDGATTISTVRLPDTKLTSDKISLKYIPTEAKVQLVSGSVVLGEIDLPFEAMVTSSELTKDNKLKLTFNTTNGPQEVLVDLNKLKDIYTAGDESIRVVANKILVKLSATQSELAKLLISPDGLHIDDTALIAKFNDLNTAFTNIDLGTF